MKPAPVPCAEVCAAAADDEAADEMDCTWLATLDEAACWTDASDEVATAYSDWMAVPGKQARHRISRRACMRST